MFDFIGFVLPEEYFQPVSRLFEIALQKAK